jgi:predicted RNA-binding protein YlqC (UPF0109 family)
MPTEVDDENIGADEQVDVDMELDEELVSDADSVVDDSDSSFAAGEDEMPSDRVADLVEYIVCSLVQDVDAVSLDVTDSDEGTLIEITCAADDAGRVIGRKGRTIKSIRTLARALGQRVGTSVEVEVLD